MKSNIQTSFHRVILRSDVLTAYPPGTRVQIGSRCFVRMKTGSFWHEETHAPQNASKTSATLEHLENTAGQRHVVLTEVEAEAFA